MTDNLSKKNGISPIQTKPLHILTQCSLILTIVTTISACSVITVQERENISSKLNEKYSESRIWSKIESLYWEKSFPSKQLFSDVQQLLVENFELEAARARVEQAAAVYRITRAELFPSIDAEAGFERYRIDNKTRNGSTTSGSTISLGALLQWEPDIWGRLQARNTASSLLLDEEHVLSEQVALNLQFLLVESWVNYHAAHNLEQVLLAQQKTNQQILELTELRLAQGDGNSLDVLQQKGRLAGIERRMPGVIFAKQSAINGYEVLMGRLPGKDCKLEDNWPTLQPLHTVTSPRQLMSDRPDLQAAFLALQAADHKVAAAIGDRLPRISIELLYTETGGNLSKIGDHSVLNFTTGLLAPLFNYGKLKTKVEQQEAQARELLAILNQTLLIAVKEVENALGREMALFNKYTMLSNELNIADETVSKAKIQYVNGQQTFLPVLAALTKQQTLEQDRITLKKEILINRGQLLKALGAKWSHHSENI
jgi:NodT family efflux transporter outer membrane factor (OMF) lipoprotein